jgi:hypothetical protein
MAATAAVGAAVAVANTKGGNFPLIVAPSFYTLIFW